MRISAGLGVEQVDAWSEDLGRRRCCIFFIYLQDPVVITATPQFSPFGPTGAVIMVPMLANIPPIGMISLSLTNAHDPTLASFATTGRIEITALWVYSAYRHLQVGPLAVLEMERRALSIGARALTLQTPATMQSLAVYNQLGYREFKARSEGYARTDSMIWTVNVASAYLEKVIR